MKQIICNFNEFLTWEPTSTLPYLSARNGFSTKSLNKSIIMNAVIETNRTVLESSR